MSTLAPFGFQAAQTRRSVNEYYVPASDASSYAVGDPVRTNGSVFVGRLPDSRVSQGMLHVGKATPGDAVRGVVVGIVGGPGDNSAQSVPATKQRAYTLLVNDSPQAIWDVQANNAAALAVMSGMYASYAVGGPRGGVSSTVVDADTISAAANDLLIVEVLTNTGANSLLRVAFVQHEMAAAGGTPQIQALMTETGIADSLSALAKDADQGVNFGTDEVILSAAGSFLLRAAKCRIVRVKCLSGTADVTLRNGITNSVTAADTTSRILWKGTGIIAGSEPYVPRGDNGTGILVTEGLHLTLAGTTPVVAIYIR